MSLLPDITDDSWLRTSLAAVICLLLYIYYQWRQKAKGPVGLPYLGYYPFLSQHFHLQLNKMSQKYGEAFCFTVTGQTYVHVGSVKAVKEAHVTKINHFRERPQNFSLLSDVFGEGVAFMNGESWKVLRKFFVHLMKEYGMGKQSLENVVEECLRSTLDILRKSQGQNFDALEHFTVSSTKVIQRLLLSGTKVDDDDFRGIVENYKIVIKSLEDKKILLAGPLLKHILLPLVPELRTYRKCKLKIDSILIKIIREHEKDFKKDNLRDLIDWYINERKMLEGRGDPKAQIFSERTLVTTLLNFFGDGSLSVGYYIAMVLKDIAGRPEVQEGIQRELDEVVGRNRLPTYGDKNYLPYTNAAIVESVRLNSFLFAFPSLECARDTTLCGSPVPKGSVLLINFWAAFHDPDVYEEPDKYDLTRFLPNEDKKPRCELPIVFGVGKRSCIGEPLVSMETFLSITTVLQNFDLSPAEEDKAGSPGKQDSEYNAFFRATPRAI